MSTVNNDPAHFDNASFLPSYQEMQTPSAYNGWFDPEGDAVWRFLGCKVTSAWLPGGAVPATDPVLSCAIADSDTRPPAKLVDLDSEQQLVSEIWGLQVRIADASGNTLLVADFEPAAFMDIWDRATGTSAGDQIAGAMYQSVLGNLQWGNIEGSPFLMALRDAATQGVLSIKFNVDGFNLDFTSPDFMTGRIVGTIGPATLAEPQHLVLGRQFMAAAGNGNFFAPAGKLNFCVGVVDASASCIYLDLENALSTSAPGGPLNNWGDLSLGGLQSTRDPGQPRRLYHRSGHGARHGSQRLCVRRSLVLSDCWRRRLEHRVGTIGHGATGTSGAERRSRRVDLRVVERRVRQSRPLCL